MKLRLQIAIITDLLEGVKELNDCHQEGWDDTIKEGKELLKYLKEQQINTTHSE